MTYNCNPEQSESEAFSFHDIFEIQEIQNAQDLFSKATGVSSIITGTDGTPLTCASNFSKFCEIVRSSDLGCSNCVKSDAEIGRLNQSGPTIQPCLSAGLLDAGVSIIVDGKHIANWLIGQVRNNGIDEQRIVQYSEQIGVDKNEFLNALEEVPVMSTEQFGHVAQMLYVFANQLAEKAQLNFNLQKRLDKQQELNEELSEKKNLLSITLDSIGDGVITTDNTGLIINMNLKAEQFCGDSLSVLKGTNINEIFKLVDPDNSNTYINPLKKVLENAIVIGPETNEVLLLKESKNYFISNKISPVVNEFGSVNGAVIVFSDITHQHIAEEKIRKSETRYRKLLEDIDAGVVLHASDSSVLFTNPKATELLGLTAEQLMGKKSVDPYWNFFHESGDPMKVEDFPVNVILRQKSPLHNYILGVKRAENENLVWLILNGDLLLDEKGNVVEVVISFTNISERKRMEDVLIEKEKYLNDTQTVARLGSFSLDIESNSWTATAILNEIFGIDAEFKKTVENWMTIIHPDWRNEISKYFEENVQNHSESFDKEYKIIKQNDGEVRWVQCKGELIYDNNRPVKIIGIVQDVNERVLAQKALQVSEQKYRKIFENVQDVYFQIDLNGFVKEVSPSIKYFTDFNRNEIVDSHILNLYRNPSEREILLKKIYENGEVVDYELDLVSKSNVIKNGSLNARLLKDSDGNPTCIEGTIRDITKRKQAEKKLRESENKFHDYIKFAPHGIFVANENGIYTDVNPTASNITGYSESELLSMNPVELIAAESVEKFRNHFNLAMQSGYATDEFILVKKNSEKRYVNVDTVKLDCNRYLGYVVDITKRKVAEQALKMSENFLKETQLISQMGAYKVDFIAGTWELSDILKSILGVQNDFDNSILKIVDFIIHEDRKEIVDYFEKEVIVEKKKFDKKIKINRISDNNVLWIHVLGEVVYNSDNQPRMMIGTVQDITKRKTLAEALRKSEALYKSILNASPDAIIVTELNGDIRMISPAAKTLFGAEQEFKLIGENVFNFFEENDKIRARQNCDLMFEEYLGTAEYQIKPIVGKVFYAEVNGDVIWGNDGLPTGMVFVVRDITDRKLAEITLKKSQQQIKKFAAHLQSVREEEKVMLAREIHDELGQILIALKIDMGLLKQNILKSIKNNESEDILTKFDNIFGTVDNTIKTTRKIMTDLRPEILYMVGFIEAIKFYSKKFEERNKIKCLFQKVENVELDSEQSIALFRIFQEALTNIVKHSKATQVTIKLFVENSKLFFVIKDNGIGFRKNQKIKIDSFGLIGIQERVFLLEGELQITAKPGMGTEIKVSLPYYKNINQGNKN